MSNIKKQAGFTLIETLVVIAIIGIIASIILASLTTARKKARDVKRKVEISQIGRFLSASCYLPDGGAGEYDLTDLLDELKIKFPQYEKIFQQAPRDPLRGSDTESFYRYLITAGGEDCAIYANLENDGDPVTLSGITTPTANGGTGVLEAASDGWNNSPKYFQVSN